MMVAPDIAAGLDALAKALDALAGGGAPGESQAHAIAADIARLGEWAHAHLAAGGESADASAPAGSGWRADYLGLPGLGGTLTLHGPDRELLLGLDAGGQPYMAIWQPLPADDKNNRALSLQLERTPAGLQLKVEGEGLPQPLNLPVGSAVAWGTLGGFFKAPAFVPAKPGIGPAKPGVAPAKPEPVPALAIETCEKCGAALKPQAKFCGHCGAAVVHHPPPPPAPPEARFCSRCGAALKPQSKFCSQCGAKDA